MKPAFVSKVSNVMAWLAAFEALKSRGASESCLMLVDGEPGLGKTRTAVWWGAQNTAIHVRAKQGWTHSWCLRDLYAATTGRPAPARDVGRLFEALVPALEARLAQAGRTGQPPIIVIDEADHAVAAGREVIDGIRDVTDMLEIPTVLVGMDRIRKRMDRYPQVASRISQKVEFRPLTRDDTWAVFDGVCEVEVREDLVAFAHRASGGRTREMKEAIATIERFGLRQSGGAVGVEAMRGLVLLHDRETGAPVAVA